MRRTHLSRKGHKVGAQDVAVMKILRHRKRFLRMTCAVGLSSPPVVSLSGAKDLLPVAIEKRLFDVS